MSDFRRFEPDWVIHLEFDWVSTDGDRPYTYLCQRCAEAHPYLKAETLAGPHDLVCGLLECPNPAAFVLRLPIPLAREASDDESSQPDGRDVPGAGPGGPAGL